MGHKNIVHLLSGGLDSVAMLYDLKSQGHSVQCLLFDYRQRHKQELLWAKQHAAKCGVVYEVMDLPDLGGLTEQSWIVPNRNSVFLSVAVNVACKSNYDTVTIGCNADDVGYFPDCRPEFIDAMNRAVRLAGYSVEICAPYLDLTKKDIGEIAKRFGITYDDVWTCYQPKESRPCGECPACMKLKGAYVDSL
jgi:7-cyano-7-deazaguanine synthase